MTARDHQTGYGRDLAAVHHRDFGHVARQAAARLLVELRSRRPVDRLVVDLGSGSGILARILTEAGYEVVGVELSDEMIRLAAEEAPRASFIQGSAVDFDPPPCAAVVATGEIFNYAFDRRTSLSLLAKLFRRVHDALDPRGVFMFDVAGPGRAGPRGVNEGWHDRDDYTLFFRITEDAPRRTLVREIVLFTRTGDAYRRSDESHVLRLYDPRDIEARLRATGFKVRRLRGYGGEPLHPGWHAFLATK